MISAVYEGRVLHGRRDPAHRFEYRLFMMYLDLGEVDALLARSRLFGRGPLAPARFRRKDYHGPADLPLDEAVRRTVAQKLGFRPEGPIRMLTHLRYFGVCLNPVTFYYCFKPDQPVIEAILAEINNTPWNERYCYALRPAETEPGASMDFAMDKDFHVSPFLPMEMRYHWRFTTPDEALSVRMENHRQDRREFFAELRLTRREATPATLRRVTRRYPLMTLKVIAAIYWQAFRLWRKGASFHVHPDKRAAATASRRENAAPET